MQKSDILSKYSNVEDKMLIAKIMDKLDDVNFKKQFSYTFFLDMHQQKIAQEFLNKQKINNYFLFGGSKQVERQILYLYSDKISEEIAKKEANKSIVVIRIELPKYKKEEYTHREYLGGVMKLGVKREKIGDIIVSVDGADIIVEKDISEYLRDNLIKLTRFSKSKIEILDIEQIRIMETKYDELIIITPSMRVDSIVSELLKISRKKTNEIMNAERVSINFEVCLNHSKIIKINDKLSIRGKGRYEVSEIVGKTKNDNIRLKVLKYI